MKKTLLPCLFVFLCLIANAQPFRRADNSAFDNALQTIFFDFAKDFRSIQGDLVVDEAEYEKYSSTVQLPGAMECIITRFHSIFDTTASWQATMLVTEEYQDAKQTYKAICHQVKSARLVLVDGSFIFFKSNYEAPSEEKRFSTSFYYLPVSDPKFRNVFVEVELLSFLTEYKVVVNVHSKPRDTMD